MKISPLCFLILFIGCANLSVLGQEKLVQFAPHVAVPSAKVVVEMPQAFPQLINTGNAMEDMKNLAQRKAEWVKANEEEYESIKKQLSEEIAYVNEHPEMFSSEERGDKATAPIILNFTEKVGNIRPAKLFWILEHEEEFRKMVNSVEAEDTINLVKKIFRNKY